MALEVEEGWPASALKKVVGEESGRNGKCKGKLVSRWRDTEGSEWLEKMEAERQRGWRSPPFGEPSQIPAHLPHSGSPFHCGPNPMVPLRSPSLSRLPVRGREAGRDSFLRTPVAPGPALGTPWALGKYL